MLDGQLSDQVIDQGRLAAYFEQIQPELYRYPALDPGTFRERVARFTTGPDTARADDDR